MVLVRAACRPQGSALPATGLCHRLVQPLGCKLMKGYDVKDVRGYMARNGHVKGFMIRVMQLHCPFFMPVRMGGKRVESC